MIAPALVSYMYQKCKKKTFRLFWTAVINFTNLFIQLCPPEWFSLIILIKAWKDNFAHDTIFWPVLLQALVVAFAFLLK